MRDFPNIGNLLLAERERWILWLPIALGSGIALYFGLETEPPRWIGPLMLLTFVAAGWVLRGRLALLMLFVGLAVAALGFTVAVERSHHVEAPILKRPTGMIELKGRIAEVEPLEKGVRVLLDRLELPRLRHGGEEPEQVRIRLPKDVTGLRPGQLISVTASLLPPPMPAAPGAYDFPRQAWFKGIGAVGYAVEAPVVLSENDEEGWGESLRLTIANLRHRLTERIVSTIDAAGIEPGVGATAAALITAEKGPVPPVVLQNYRDSGLAHILVIAGMHMSMVAGLVFVAVRGILAAIPPIALRYPIKKWTAAAALAITFGYLVISGAPVPTQRAFLMNGIVLVAVLLDREAISLRSITWAALLILLWQPEALVGASFQMSFAAVYGLISGYEVMGPKMMSWRHQGAKTWWREPLFHLLAILLTTQIAGTSTGYYTVYHFNRSATYSLLGNAVAVPIVGFWVMPAALMAFVLMPFGLDGWGWQVMGWGIVAVNRVAAFVSSLPGATANLHSLTTASLILFTLGGFWLLLWKGRWRLWGLPVMAVGILVGWLHSPPDLMVDGSGKLAAWRLEDGTMALNQKRGGRSQRQTWIKEAGQGSQAPLWSDLPPDVAACDSLGCVLHGKGHVVAVARRPEALVDDCLAADLVVVAVPVRTACPSAKLLIDGLDLRLRGTHQFWLKPDGIEVQSVADWQGNRPWSRHPRLHRKPIEPAPPKPAEPAESEDGEDDPAADLGDRASGE